MRSPTIELLLSCKIATPGARDRGPAEGGAREIAWPSSSGSQPRRLRSSRPRASCASSRPQEDLETEIGSAETQRGKYQPQQLSVKEERWYQALGHQIQTVQKQIGELEGRELETMYSIDEAREAFRRSRGHPQAEHRRPRGAHPLDEGEGGEPGRGAEGGRCRRGAGPGRLRRPPSQAYDRAAARRMPAVVAIRGGKCGGCHLKVSSEVESAARGKATDTEFALCDQCGQMVYWES